MSNTLVDTLPKVYTSAPVPVACIPAKPKSRFEIIVAEVFAVLTGILPNAIRWVYRRYITKDITSHTLQEPVNAIVNVTKKAFLNQHGALFPSSRAILFLHGDSAHPYSVLHLADIAQKEQVGPVFSLYLPYDDSDPTIHRALLTQAINRIEGLGFPGLTVVGHSKGVIESAYMALVEKDERIKSLIAWAGRLRVTDSCEEGLHDTINKIYAALLQSPTFPLFKISAGQDWCCPEPESTQVLPHQNLYVAENASHLNVLFDKEALKQYVTFLRQA